MTGSETRALGDDSHIWRGVPEDDAGCSGADMTVHVSLSSGRFRRPSGDSSTEVHHFLDHEKRDRRERVDRRNQPEGHAVHAVRQGRADSEGGGHLETAALAPQSPALYYVTFAFIALLQCTTMVA